MWKLVSNSEAYFFFLSKDFNCGVISDYKNVNNWLPQVHFAIVLIAFLRKGLCVIGLYTLCDKQHMVSD